MDLFLFVIISYFNADLFHYLLYDFYCGLNFHGTLPMVRHWAPGWRWFLPGRTYSSFCQATGTLPIWNCFKFNSGLWLENLMGRFFFCPSIYPQPRLRQSSITSPFGSWNYVKASIQLSYSHRPWSLLSITHLSKLLK